MVRVDLDAAGAAATSDPYLPTFARHRGLLFRRTPVAVVVCHRDGGDVSVITGSGAVLWDLLGEPITVDEAARALASVYDMPIGTVTEAVTQTLSDLTARGLCEAVGRP